ncbi:MAG: hypothetical protein Q9163_002219 [Psora crenata]
MSSIPEPCPGNVVLERYHKFSKRRVDLVGDYAGNELFLIEGDSLLLRCMSEAELDYDGGFQLLHAVYAVEKFIQNLLQRKCNFHIAFFDSHRDLCVPEWVSTLNRPKYLLTRAVIYEHFKANLPQSQASIKLHSFRSVVDPAFMEYLKSTGVYFVMCHDGAGAATSLPPAMDDDMNAHPARQLKEEKSTSKLRFRSMICFLLDEGYNVALVNELDWQDTKVMTEVVEGYREARVALIRSTKDFLLLEGLEPSNRDFAKPGIQNADADGGTNSLIAIQSALAERRCTCKCGSTQPLDPGRWTQRRYLTVIALKKLLLENAETKHFAAIYLLHIALLEVLPLARRRVRFGSVGADRHYGPHISSGMMAESLLSIIRSNKLWEDIRVLAVCDIADLVDGRLLVAATTCVPEWKNETTLRSSFQEQAHLLCVLTGVHLGMPINDAVEKPAIASVNVLETVQPTILPFSNAVFDKHLAPIKLATKSVKGLNSESGRVFREVTHWHNAKRTLNTKMPAPLSEKHKKRAARRNDRFMADMQSYAASLTNATGKSLEPQTITVGGKGMIPEVGKENESSAKALAAQAGPKATSKAGQKGKGGKKEGMLERLAAERAAKDNNQADRVFSAWRTVRKNLDAERSLVGKYHKIGAYLRDLPDAKRRIVGAEVQLHLGCVLVDIYREVCKGQDLSMNAPSSESLGVRALLWDTIRKVPSYTGFTKTMADMTREIVRVLKLPGIDLPCPTEDRRLAFDPQLLLSGLDGAMPQLNGQQFQLLHCGPYMDRNLDSAPDKRVPFEPDAWQRTVLNELDARHSLFVVAPTSSGKTFISFYAMEEILRSSNESVLVYVAPTKALVTQIAAEIQARFQKTYKAPGKSVWAIHTRDYRINNPSGCQILVTVPHILQIMLLTPSNARSWSTRVEYIIFDEIHSIGQAEDGVVWEQLLLLAPCPIIALSATVGNPEKFSSWLSETQEASGNCLTMIQHSHRYSDLRKFVYCPPERFAFRGLVDRPNFGILGLDNVRGLEFMHPVASLVNRSRGMPPDLSLEPRDCLLLYESMARYQTADYPVDRNMGPSSAFSAGIIRKADVIKWEKSLKSILQDWLMDEKSPFDKVIEDLSGTIKTNSAPMEDVSKGELTETQAQDLIKVDRESLEGTTLPLLCKLHERNALPAIFFNYDRSKCEGICQTVTQQLEQTETKWKESNPAWKAKLNGFEKYKKEKAKIASKKAPKQAKKRGEGNDDPKTDKLLDASNDDVDPYAGFDPEDPVDGYHFAAKHKAEVGELSKYYYDIKKRDLPSWLIAGLKRGIGVHHAGMNRKYRQVVEMLFRKGYLRVVFATGTLALGINMPCATVVFSGDSIFLTALNFRQAAGRAGRRGFDLLGNVVCRLLSSRLPDLNGHFPVTTTLVLRLFTLLHESNGSAYATRAINSLLSQPRLYLDGPAFKDQVLHHLRFSIEYLRRQDLLSPGGAPINFAGLTSHLYFTENSSFALNALIKNGYFHELCSAIGSNESRVLRTLMLVMAHLFGRRPCRQADAEYMDVVKRSSSIVFLPPLPLNAASILVQHNQDTLQIFTTYVRTFVDQYLNTADTILPLTGVAAGGTHSSVQLYDPLPPTKVRSAFVALSGHGDEFRTISDLCRTTRNGVFLEEAVIPHIDLHPEESKAPLNAYLYDFFMHGDVATLERANGIRKADVWFFLNDFSLVLATIVASLANFLKLSETDISLEDLAGEGDDHGDVEDDKVADDSTVTSVSSANTMATADTGKTSIGTSSSMSKPPKKKVAESWDDAADQEEEEEADAARKAVEDDPSKEELERGFLNIYRAMVKLRTEFDTKFRKIFA